MFRKGEILFDTTTAAAAAANRLDSIVRSWPIVEFDLIFTLFYWLIFPYSVRKRCQIRP